ncbi:uncharacterized protein LOC123004438 [Tribolium madens]|uniref:uncharacterized protein LOC123004438 n=1 Tax=Tribolium madens TaxID=41895 RepID=UPI001CF75AD4|nr:uncharacterized protein LOC123004438 [Tribolium madens]
MDKIVCVFVLCATLAKSQINLEYKPVRPFYHPKPGTTLGQIVPPGKPWPDKPEDQQNVTQTPVLENKIKETTIPTTPPKPGVTLDYKPSRPPFHPNPGSTLGQIVPPGQPWPNKPDGYQNFSQLMPGINLENKMKDTVSTTEQPGTTIFSLEYKPNRPPHHPNPGSILGQIIPPGQPWPDKPEGYQNFSQLSPELSSSTVSLENKIQETATSTKKPSTNLEYQPNRPTFHPSPGTILGQIIPPGQPWPDRLEGYQNFTQTKPTGFVWETENNKTTKPGQATLAPNQIKNNFENKITDIVSILSQPSTNVANSDKQPSSLDQNKVEVTKPGLVTPTQNQTNNFGETIKETQSPDIDYKSNSTENLTHSKPRLETTLTMTTNPVDSFDDAIRDTISELKPGTQLKPSEIGKMSGENERSPDINYKPNIENLTQSKPRLEITSINSFDDAIRDTASVLSPGTQPKPSKIGTTSGVNERSPDINYKPNTENVTQSKPSGTTKPRLEIIEDAIRDTVSVSNPGVQPKPNHGEIDGPGLWKIATSENILTEGLLYTSAPLKPKPSTEKILINHRRPKPRLGYMKATVPTNVLVPFDWLPSFFSF